MSSLALAVVSQIAMSCPAASSGLPGSAVERALATAQAESGLRTTVLHDNTTDRSYAPTTEAEAVALANILRQQGHSVDAGLMQINDKNWQRLGLGPESVFDPRKNICAGMTILAEAYAIERRVSCRYNTGRPECSNGYPERLEEALRRMRAEGAGNIPVVSPASGPIAAPTTVNPFVNHGSVREMVFAPSSRSAAPPRFEVRPSAPTVPHSLTAASDQGLGEFITIRSAER